ncbi:MAG: glycosyltransferase family 2 protein [Ignavibacteria bacterium]|nr:glycosyltransferase family 2 protein [Ignavibacteria bacterium]MBT8383598.1 glycosyltransferase family 2 protein [Ignavibacteria bacterium]MBT8392932.1 glycosyltransferase family 2 protein [Ignavibacteria bacterium]NNL20731.1 glycosyltransferase family 2 protein [Ignavibacteriaceae bacterium]
MNFVIIIFFLCLILIFHTYVFYPISIQLISLFFKRRYKKDELPSHKISILISAYNEDSTIENTINNLYKQNYPANRFEIIVGSDGSMDRTNEILSGFSKNNSNLIFIPFKKRRGKKFVINDLVKRANGEILVFCDSNTVYKPNAITEMMKYYADGKIGGVSGRLELIEKINSTSKSNKEVTYWKYESWIKYCEGSLGCLIGANGGIYSIKKEYFISMPDDISVVDDLYLSLKVLEQGKDMVYCKDAIARENIAPSIKFETERKARIIPRSFETIKQVKKLLLSNRVLVSYNLWSHKIIRWFTPLILMILFASNLVISMFGKGIFYNTVLGLQLLIIFLSLIGYLTSKLSINIKIFQLSYYFLISNYALMKGFYRYITKKYKPTWDPTPR